MPRWIKSLFITETGEGIGILAYFILAVIAVAADFAAFKLFEIIGFTAFMILSATIMTVVSVWFGFFVRDTLKQKRERTGPYAIKAQE